MARIPMFGHTFLAITLMTQRFMGTQETINIIYRLMVRNPNKGAYFSVEVFFGLHFWRKMDAATTRPLWFGASKPDQKVGPLGGPFESTTISISKLCFRNFQW